MQNAIALQDWLEVIDAEYLSSFIRNGGASVKFAITPAEVRVDLSARTRDLCEKRGYLLVELNATVMRAYMPQDIFFEMANQIDWRSTARRRILRLAAERNYQVSDIHPDVVDNIFQAIADANHLESQSVLMALRPAIQDEISKNPYMAKDFRVAMSHLCLNENDRGSTEDADQSLLEWLTGRSTRVSSVRQFSIYTPINRTTARYFIESALYWIHSVGYTGTVILFDNSRVMVARNPRDGLRYYSRSMAVDHYELLREFIDAVDRLVSTLLIVTPNEDFVEESPRSYGIYDALRTRIMNDVRDRNRGNPIASLVRLPYEVNHDTTG